MVLLAQDTPAQDIPATHFSFTFQFQSATATYPISHTLSSQTRPTAEVYHGWYGSQDYLQGSIGLGADPLLAKGAAAARGTNAFIATLPKECYLALVHATMICSGEAPEYFGLPWFGHWRGAGSLPSWLLV